MAVVAIALVADGPIRIGCVDQARFAVFQGRDIVLFEFRDDERCAARDAALSFRPPAAADGVLQKRIDGVQGPAQRAEAAGEDQVGKTTLDHDSLLSQAAQIQIGSDLAGGARTDRNCRTLAALLWGDDREFRPRGLLEETGQFLGGMLFGRRMVPRQCNHAGGLAIGRKGDLGCPFARLQR